MIRATAATKKRFLAWFVALVAVDWATKAISSTAAPTGFGPFQPRTNPELALGLAQLDSPWYVLGPILIATIAALAHAVSLTVRGHLSASILGIGLGGIFANAVDRVATGAVHDFFRVGAVVINVADAAILVLLSGYAVVAWNRSS